MTVDDEDAISLMKRLANPKDGDRSDQTLRGKIGLSRERWSTPCGQPS
ncbi:hypothetical protein [Bradyrhizobium sp. WSM2793]|nr:hypothetical protein [Bradyrhizobium sp. WSM2793]